MNDDPTRRDVTAGVAAVPLVLAAGAALAGTGNVVRHRGALHPVNGHWHEANSVRWPHLAAMEKDALEERRTALLRISNDRRLTKAEYAELDAVTNHSNVRNAIAFLDGRPHTDFGYTGVDQVHGNRITHGCGCELHIVFDHHKRHESEQDHHAHTPRYVCDKHVHLKHDLALLHSRVRDDNRA
jgi:hypothetical protein